MAKIAQIKLHDSGGDLGKRPVVSRFLEKYCGNDKGGFVLEFQVFEMTTASIEVLKGAADARLGLTTNETFYIVSTDAKDVAAGVGTQGVMILGLRKDTDDNWEYRAVYAPTGGLTKTDITTYDFCEIIDAFPIANGSEANPAGDITICRKTGDTKVLTISAGELFSNGSSIIVPVGYYAELLTFGGIWTSTPGVNEALILTHNYINFGINNNIDDHVHRDGLSANVVLPSISCCEHLANSKALSIVTLSQNHLVGAETMDVSVFIGIKKFK